MLFSMCFGRVTLSLVPFLIITNKIKQVSCLPLHHVWIADSWLRFHNNAGYNFDFHTRECVEDSEDPANKEERCTPCVAELLFRCTTNVRK